MPTLVIFIALAILLAFILALIVLLPWLQADKSVQNNQLIALNVEVFKQRLTELSDDYGKGLITKSEFRSQKTELEKQLLLASDDKDQLSNGQNTSQNSDDDRDARAVKSELQFTKSLKARLTVLLCVPILLLLGYFMSGDRSSVAKFWQAQDKVGQVADDLLTAKIDMPPEWAAEDTVGLMGAIQANVHHHAHDAQRWMRLADIFLMFDATEQALEAQARAYRLHPEDEDIAVAYAQTKFFTNGGFIDSSSKQALQNVLQKNPNHQGAQMLMAMGEARAGNFDDAQAWIDKLRVGISSREGDHTAALNSLDELSASIAAQKEASLSQQTANNTTSTSNNQVEITVTVNPSLLPLVNNNDTLFVTIQESSGGAPLAVKRLPAAQLINAPQGIKITLDDKDAMMPTHTLSSAINKNLSMVAKARISKTGEATIKSGDLLANETPLNVQDMETEAVQLNIEINKQQP